MHVEVLDAADAVARRVADLIDAALRGAIDARGHATLALSGGSSPWEMVGLLAARPLPWSAVDVLQVDERVAPTGSDARNRTHIDAHLQTAVGAGATFHPMPVDDPCADALEQGARDYARLVERVAGDPPVLDAAHLGIGPDGHVASLVADDPVLVVDDRAVALTGDYQGHRRMTLTYPALGAAGLLVWLVLGAAVAPAVRQLVDGDPTIPATRLAALGGARAVLVCDRAAAARL